MTYDQMHKYNYYVESLLLNIPTTEPTESITYIPSFAPTTTPQIILSTNSDSKYLLQCIITICIATSIFTTCCVICTGYCCVIFRSKMREVYLNRIFGNNGTDCGTTLSNDSVGIEPQEQPTDSYEEQGISNEKVLFWFDDVYLENKV